MKKLILACSACAGAAHNNVRHAASGAPNRIAVIENTSRIGSGPSPRHGKQTPANARYSDFTKFCMQTNHRSRSARLGAVLLIGHRFQPRHVLAFEGFLHGEVLHAVIAAPRRANASRPAESRPCRRRGPRGWPAPGLHPADARDDGKRLPERMSMPGGTRTRLEPHPGRTDARGIGRLDDRVLPHRPGEARRPILRDGREPQAIMSMLNSSRFSFAGILSASRRLSRRPRVSKKPGVAAGLHRHSR